MVKTMTKWKIGDRVVCTKDHPDANHDIVVGSSGTVCAISGRRVGVRWDEPIERGHECIFNNKVGCERGHGWWVDRSCLELEQDDDADFGFDEDEFIKLVFGG